MLRRGFAKRQFEDAFRRAPWIEYERKQEESSFLDQLLEIKRISYLEVDLVRHLMRLHPWIKEAVPLFLIHLILAAKEGHLCIQIQDGWVEPSVINLWKNDEGESLTNDQARDLTQQVIEGAQYIPKELITETFQLEEMPLTPICKNGNAYYLQRHWVYESLFLKHFMKHLNTPPNFVLNRKNVEEVAGRLCEERILIKEQAQAVIQGCQHALTLISGGPGTGKTYTAGYFIKIFWEHLSEEQKSKCEIVLAAPTGKAAANLQQSFNKMTSSTEGFPSIQTKTLHALLGLKRSPYLQDPVRLTADLIVIDESSMMDIRMMAALFASLKPGSRVILLGDKDQLPSIEAGSIFSDLIHLQPNLSVPLPCVTLSVCMRAELKSLVDFGNLIKNGAGEEMLNLMKQPGESGVKYLPLPEDKREFQGEFLKMILPLFPTIISSISSPVEVLNLFQSVRLLSPLRKGPFGVETLNQLIWEKISQNLPKKGYLAIPIMIVSNDYRQELFNGETGVLIRHLPLHSSDLEDYALFPSRDDQGAVRRFSPWLLPKYELAYCLSVHKSQGSEFGRVIVVLPQGSELFERELLYTAVTRARQSIEIFSTDSVILKTMQLKGTRLSGIANRLQKLKLPL